MNRGRARIAEVSQRSVLHVFGVRENCGSQVGIFSTMNIAVIKTGGKQYLITAGKKIQVEKLVIPAGESLPMETLLVSDPEGKNVKLGKPALPALTGTAVQRTTHNEDGL